MGIEIPHLPHNSLISLNSILATETTLAAYPLSLNILAVTDLTLLGQISDLAGMGVVYGAVTASPMN